MEIGDTAEAPGLAGLPGCTFEVEELALGSFGWVLPTTSFFGVKGMKGGYDKEMV